MSLTIGIDGRPLIGNLSGVGKYVHEICLELDKLLPKATFYIYSPTKISLPLKKSNWISREDSKFFAKKIKPVLWLKYFCGNLVKRDSLDFFWGTSHFLPNLPKSVQSILTIHDIVYKIAPRTMPNGNYWAHRLFFKKDIKKANFLIANSEGTKTRLESTFHLPIHSIARPCVNSTFRKIEHNTLISFLVSKNINYPYFLSVATWEPRKNLPLLIEAFKELKANEASLQDFKLLLIGGVGWKTSSLVNLIDKDSEKDIIPLGYIPEADLPFYFCGAKSFIFPSKYEGFGMPVLEARACHTPIITTDIMELREAGQEQAVYISPTKNGIQSGILKILNEEYSNRPNPSPLPTWSESAQAYAQIFKQKNSFKRSIY